VINLVVQAFLFVRDKRAVKQAIVTADYNEDVQVEDEIVNKSKDSWIKVGALHKLHIIIILIRSSELLYQEFLEQTGQSIPLNNNTKWNSWYIMMDVSLTIKPYI
jgi:hypothetical protein